MEKYMPELEQLYLPSYPPKPEPLVIAHDLDKIPPPASTLPNLGGKHYARSLMVYPEKKVNVQLPIIRFTGTDPLEAARLVDRGLQRAAQFKKITHQVTRWDAQLNQGLTPTFSLAHESEGTVRRNSYEVTPQFLDRLSQIIDSFYERELSLDPLTKELANLTIEWRESMETAAIREVERIHFEHKYQDATDIFVMREEITCKSQEPADEKPDQIKPKPNDIKNSEIISVGDLTGDELNTEAVLKAVEEIIKPPDLPNSGAAKYIEELWNRPF